MRRMIMTSLVLLPVLANAQARTATEPQPSPSSAVLSAELTQPFSALAVEAANAMAALPSTSIAAMNASSHPMVREFVKLSMAQNFSDAALMQGGTLEYAMMGSAPMEASAPKVTRAVEVSLTPAELAEQPAVSNVVVHAIVDVNGVPRNVAVTHSGGSVMDRRVVEAVNQYRFQPATLDNRPTWSAVSIAIKIQKP